MVLIVIKLNQRLLRLFRFVGGLIAKTPVRRYGKATFLRASTLQEDDQK
jgi:hypothetical protein